MQVRNFKKTAFFRKMRKTEQILQAVSANFGWLQRTSAGSGGLRRAPVVADVIGRIYPDFPSFRVFSV